MRLDWKAIASGDWPTHNSAALVVLTSGRVAPPTPSRYRAIQEQKSFAGFLRRPTVCRRLNRFVLPKTVSPLCVKASGIHGTRVLLQTVGWTRSNISEHLRGAMGLRADWISLRFVTPSPMRPLTMSHSAAGSTISTGTTATWWESWQS